VNRIGIIAAKELRSYLASPMPYVAGAVFLAFSGASFVAYLAGTDYMDTSIRGFLDAAQFLILVFAALLTMRLVAEERKLGTWELMLTVPVRDVDIVVGKYIASLAVLTGMLMMTLYFPLMLVLFGDPDLGPIATSYLGLFLLGAAALAVGVFASSVTTYQVVAAVIALGILFCLWFLGAAASAAPGALGEVLSSLSLSRYFPDFVRGVIDSRAVVYALSLTVLFLYLAVRSIESERWR
jgi:ABC-2 type transport system permease protein